MTSPGMSAVRAKRDAIAAELQRLAQGDTRARYYELGDDVDPPAVLVGVPALTWDSLCAAPTMARFPVILCAPANERAVNYLLDNFDAVVDAIESVVDVTVTTVTPTSWVVGTTELPCYDITAEVAL